MTIALVIVWYNGNVPSIQQVVEMISVAIGDLMRAEFTRLRDSHGSAILPDDGATVEDWEQQTFLSSGSLLARSCAAALTLARHSEAMQQKAYEFGKQIAFAYQVEFVFLCSFEPLLAIRLKFIVRHVHNFFHPSQQLVSRAVDCLVCIKT
jgi:hypothetical protein